MRSPFESIKVLQKGLRLSTLCNTFNPMTKQEREEQVARIGRPQLPDEQRGVTGSIRLTASRWAKLRRLGMAWLGKTIDRAREPKDPAA